MDQNVLNSTLRDNSDDSYNGSRVSVLFLIDASVAKESSVLLKRIIYVVSGCIRSNLRLVQQDFCASVIIYNVNPLLCRNGYELVMKFDDPRIDGLKLLMHYGNHGLENDKLDGTDPKSMLNALKECYRQFSRLQLETNRRMIFITPTSQPNLNLHALKAFLEFLSEEISITPIFYDTVNSTLDTTVFWDQVFQDIPCNSPLIFTLEQIQSEEFYRAVLCECSCQSIDFTGQLIIGGLKIDMECYKMIQPAKFPKSHHFYNNQQSRLSTESIEKNINSDNNKSEFSYVVRLDDHNSVYLPTHALEDLKSFCTSNGCKLFIEEFLPIESLKNFDFLGGQSIFIHKSTENNSSHRAFESLHRSLIRKKRIAEATLYRNSTSNQYYLPQKGFIFAFNPYSASKVPGGFYFVPIAYLDDLMSHPQTHSGFSDLKLPWMDLLVKKLSFSQGFHPLLFSNPYCSHVTSLLERRALKLTDLKQDIYDPLKPSYCSLTKKLEKILNEDSIPSTMVRFPLYYRRIIENGQYSALTSQDIEIISKLLDLQLSEDINCSREEIKSEVNKLLKRSKGDFRTKNEKLVTIFNDKRRLEEIDLRTQSIFLDRKESELDDTSINLALMIHGFPTQASPETKLTWLRKLYTFNFTSAQTDFVNDHLDIEEDQHLDEISKTKMVVHSQEDENSMQNHELDEFCSSEKIGLTVDSNSSGSPKKRFQRDSDLFPREIRNIIMNDQYEGLSISYLKMVATFLRASTSGRTIPEVQNNINKTIESIIVADGTNITDTLERKTRLAQYLSNSDVPRKLIQKAKECVMQEAFDSLSRPQIMSICKILDISSNGTTAAMSSKIKKFFCEHRITLSENGNKIHLGLVNSSFGCNNMKRESNAMILNQQKNGHLPQTQLSDKNDQSYANKNGREVTPGVVLPLPGNPPKLPNLIPQDLRVVLEGLNLVKAHSGLIGEIEVLLGIFPSSSFDPLILRKDRIIEFLKSVIENERSNLNRNRSNQKNRRMIIRQFLDSLNTPLKLLEKAQRSINRSGEDFLCENDTLKKAEISLLLRIMRIKPMNTVGDMKSQLYYEINTERNLKPLVRTSHPDFFPSYLLNALVDDSLNRLNSAELQDLCYILDIGFEDTTEESMQKAIRQYSRRKQIRNSIMESKGSSRSEKLRNYLLNLEHARRHHKQIFDCYLRNEWEHPKGPDLWAMRLVCRMYGRQAWFWWSCVFELKEAFRGRTTSDMKNEIADEEENEAQYESDYEEVSEDDGVLFGSNKYYETHHLPKDQSSDLIQRNVDSFTLFVDNLVANEVNLIPRKPSANIDSTCYKLTSPLSQINMVSESHSIPQPVQPLTSESTSNDLFIDTSKSFSKAKRSHREVLSPKVSLMSQIMPFTLFSTLSKDDQIISAVQKPVTNPNSPRSTSSKHHFISPQTHRDLNISAINFEILQRLPPAQREALLNKKLDTLGSKVLQQMCRLFKLGNQGTKNILIDRLTKHMDTV